MTTEHVTWPTAGYTYMTPALEMSLDEVKAITDYMRSVGAESFTFRGLSVKLAPDWSQAPTSFGDNKHDDDKQSERYKNALAALQDDEVSDAELEDWSR